MSKPEDLEGRIIALELLMRGFMAQVAIENSENPAEFVRGWKSEMLGSLQLMDRPIGDHEDAVWEKTADALNVAFDNVEARLIELATKG